MKPQGPDKQSHPGRAQADAVLPAVAVGGFALAFALAYREIRLPGSATLRTPGVLLMDATLATLVAVGYAAQQEVLQGIRGFARCIAFGLWSAAAFRLVPPVINEHVLYERNMLSPDVPYILLGALVHGGLAALLAWPFARRALGVEARSLRDEEQVWYLAGAAILVFFVVAAVVRVLAEFMPLRQQFPGS